MKKLILLLSVMGLALITLLMTQSLANGTLDSPPPSAMAPQAETPFDKMMSVLTHKRCVNCHPAGDHPRQGEDSHLHNFGVMRGEDNHGAPALRCSSCHQQENNNFSGVPGAPEWSLAPLSMAWEGLSRVEIARSMLNPDNNGGRSLEEVVKHLTEHELVLWAWEPGLDAAGNPRENPPVPKAEYIEAVKAWAASGAIIPEK
jgi:cytochrome c553